jgi:xeroderma pigmentosum group C-complementing protein
MVYVIALEEDSHARDVTPRYALQYGAKVAKAQLGGGGGRRTGGGGKGKQQEWWESVLDVVKRPYRLVR